uniref:Uncharacterized protein n=1 Tax=Hyaloperonospora arabidopsidis (strain Emoy2) TaxID=559515 RepID=M4BPP0_HYAAE
MGNGYKLWRIKRASRYLNILPAVYIRQAGRPKKRRIRSQVEFILKFTPYFA